MKKGLLLISAFAFLFSVQQLNAGYSSGTDHGWWWSMYNAGGSCSISFPYAGQWAGNFQVNWSGCSDVGGGKGYSTGSGQTVNYNAGWLSGYNVFGVYGWTTSPLIEYYITEMGSQSGTYVGSLSSDGHNYTVYKNQQVNQPSIQGTATFWQYFSVWGGSSTGSNHSVTTINHFNYWKAHCGQGFGNYNYMKLNAEAWGGQTGGVNATIW
jgi:endo-1,4-beta-xylanase